MNNLKLTAVIFASILLGAGIVMAGIYFFPQNLPVSGLVTQKNSQAACFPSSIDMAAQDKTEFVKQTSLNCAGFQEAKLQTVFDPKNGLTWDNAFPSREDFSRRLRELKAALMGQWVTYYNNQDRYAFAYPKGWEVFKSTVGSKIVVALSGEQLVRPMIIDIKYNKGTSDSLENERIQGGEAHMVITRDGLVGNGGRIQTSARIPDKNGKLVTVNNDYATFLYHNFYRHAEFFIDHDLVYVKQPLSVIVPDVAGWTDDLEHLLTQVNNNEVGELVSTEVELFDRIVASFHKIASVKEAEDMLGLQGK